MRRYVAIILCALVSATASLPARSASGLDVADLWWNPQESGWGLQLVQQSSTVFATLYVYDELNLPFWYTAVLSFAGLNANGGPIYSGALYESRGPHWAGFYNPTLATIAPVGSMTFNSPTTGKATLTYVINGISVTKNVERFTLVYENFNGSFTGIYRLTTSGCAKPFLNGTQNILTTFSISQNGGAMTIAGAMTDAFSAFVCTFTGTYTPTGSIGFFTGNYACTTGETGNVVFAEMQAARFTIMGRITGRNNQGCNLSGRFAATEN